MFGIKWKSTMNTPSFQTSGQAITCVLEEQDTYVIGDIHGRADLLDALLDTIRREAGTAKYQVVFLGDVIDRGPASRDALQLVHDTLIELPGSQFIIGNHEEYLIRLLERPRDIVRYRTWMDNGGVPTLRSFGIHPSGNGAGVAEQLEAVSWLVSALSKGIDIGLMSNCVFVHAGVRPNVPIDQQAVFDLRWIRDSFLGVENPLPLLVVHGHTPTRDGFPDVRRSRINLDTGAFATDRLFSLRMPKIDEPPTFLWAKTETNGGIKTGTWSPN